MREKENINLKNKINLKNLLAKNTQTSFNLQRVNIQTITKDKAQKYFSGEKKFIHKLPNKIRYLNSTITNNSINNNYFSNEDRISFFSLYNSNKEPSPINSLNSSPYSTYTKRKRNYKRLQKRNKHKYQNFNINSSNSINNLSLNSKIINTNQSVSLKSSSSSSLSYYDSSDSSDISYRSRENKRKNYKELMMAEEDELDYLKRREVGLVSSDEEENDNSIDNNNYFEENLSNEIERILIEIYNRNISIISSGGYGEINKNKNETEDVEKQIRKYLKKKNFKTSLLVLKCLSNKIKELVGKYKEKVFEIEEIKTFYDTSKLKMHLLRSNPFIHGNNSVGSNVATNSNSSYDSNNYNFYNYDEENFIKNSILNNQDEISKGISNILLRELINIKKTLKISSKEIENIFKYPLSLLKNEKGRKIKFSIELMQSEEFCKTLLYDDFIYNLLSQMKGIHAQTDFPNNSNDIDDLFKDCDHKSEMTRFVNCINEKLGSSNENIDSDSNKKIMNNYSDEYKKENSNNKNLQDEQIGKNTAFSMDTGSSVEGIPFKSAQSTKNKNSNDFEEVNKNNNVSKKKKKKKKRNNDNENKNDTNKMNFKDIDELLNYINDETDSKKGKKKDKKGKKNKKQNNLNKDKECDDNCLENKNSDNYEEEDIICEDNNDNEDKFFEEFKKDIEKNTIYVYEINKIQPFLSEEFLANKCSK